MFALIFVALQKYIQEMVPEIKYIDLDIGQLETYVDRPAVSFPCLLIDFSASTYSGLGEQVQWWDGNISTRLGFAPYSATNDKTPEVTRFKGLEYFEIESKLFKALEGFTADDTIQPMVRISANSERRDDAYRVRETIFTSSTQDNTAKNPVSVKPATLEVSHEIITD